MNKKYQLEKRLKRKKKDIIEAKNKEAGIKKMRKVYSSDVSREQFAIIQAYLEKVKVKTKARTLDLYEVFCAILYRMKNGCRWRDLPEGFPEWEAVYYYFRKWTRVKKDGFSTLDYVLGIIEDLHRAVSGRELSPSMHNDASVVSGDSKTIQNADTAEESGYDGVKKKWSEDTYGG